MTDDQKNELIGKMIDCPESLSPQDMEAIASDQELRDIYQVSASLAGAYAPMPDCKAEEQWARLRPLLMRPRRRRAWAFRAAAAVAAVALVAGLVMLRAPEPGPQLAVEIPEPASGQVSDTAAVAVTKASVAPELMANAEAVAQAKPKTAKAKPAKRKAAGKAKKAAAADTLSFDQMMRVEQARADHCQAMAMAEVYLSNYKAMKMMADQGMAPDGEYSPDTEFVEEYYQEINKLIIP